MKIFLKPVSYLSKKMLFSSMKASAVLLGAGMLVYEGAKLIGLAHPFKTKARRVIAPRVASHARYVRHAAVARKGQHK